MPAYHDDVSRAEKAAGALKNGDGGQHLSPNADHISAHLYALFAPEFVQAYPEAWIEIPCGDPAGGGVNVAGNFSVFELKQAAEFAYQKNAEGYNVYVAPGLRQGERTGRASDAVVITASHAWAEFDGDGDALRISNILKALNLKPAMTLITGTVPHTRAHLYFKLRDVPTPAQLRAINTSLMIALGSDAVHNNSRPMRLAGTINYPSPKKRKRGYVAELVSFHPVREPTKYSIEYLTELGPEAPRSKPNGTGGEKARRTDAELLALLKASQSEGNWHNSMRDAVAVMVGRGLRTDAIKLATAAYCHGETDDLDVMKFIETARKKYDKPEEPCDRTGAQSTQAKPRPEAPWPILDAAAYHGLAGDIVRLIEPHSEADPVGILLQILATFGNIIGHSPHYVVESDFHRCNIFTVLVGTSAKGRKGTSGGRVRAVTKDADEFWAVERCASGLSSGEGVINAVRDEVKKWNTKERVEEVVDPGVKDKRLMVTEPEFAGALAVMERPGNTLSPVIRNSWDGLRLQTLAKNAGQTATGAHISIVAHITEEETRRRLTRTDMANGFANRFLFCCVKRSKHLPHGGNLDGTLLAAMARRFREAVEFAKAAGRIRMTEAAAAAWTAAYPELSAERPGLLGAVIARAEAQAIRLALIFALFDSRDVIDVDHLEAAIAVWDYAEQSAVRIFGDSLGEPLADEILHALRRALDGMTRTDIRNLFSRHGTAEQFDAALASLHAAGRARFETQSTSGRPIERWFAVGGSR